MKTFFSFFLFKNISKRIRQFDVFNVYSAESDIHSGCFVRISIMSGVSDLKTNICSKTLLDLAMSTLQPCTSREVQLHVM